MRALLAAIASLAWIAQAACQPTYGDSATSQWFKSLASPYTKNCCDQADCKLAEADYRDGSWWAKSNRTGAWVMIRPDQVTSDVSIFAHAVLCEGDPNGFDGTARVFCFAPPPIGF